MNFYSLFTHLYVVKYPLASAGILPLENTS